MERERLESLEQLRRLGQRPFLTDAPAHSSYFTRKFEEGVPTSFSGRILTIRRMGKMCFATVLYCDLMWSLSLRTIQVVFQEGYTDEGWREIVKHVHIGDILYFAGEFKTTVSGEESVFVKEFSVLSKALVTVPFGQEKDGQTFNQVQDDETLMRNRHLAMLMDSRLRETLTARSKMVSRIRSSLTACNFVEAQTPVLLQIPGGAEAKTFDTVYNAYDAEVKLRISLEIQLKKLLCGGFDRVYEIGTVFRNEGVSSQHNPEFTLLEYYSAYEGFEQGLESFKALVASACHAFGSQIPISFWQTTTMRDAVLKYANEDIDTWDFSDPVSLEKLEDCMKSFVEPNLQGPTIVTHHPVAISPLARSIDGKYAERFEAYINGMEIANGFCEQNDPQAQLRVFEEQSALLGTPIDQDFIYALSCGMPPAFGVGIGIDRLVMVLSGASHIRQVSWFPFVKPVKE